jgi:hypothetical protein
VYPERWGSSSFAGWGRAKQTYSAPVGIADSWNSADPRGPDGNTEDADRGSWERETMRERWGWGGCGSQPGALGPTTQSTTATASGSCATSADRTNPHRLDATGIAPVDPGVGQSCTSDQFGEAKRGASGSSSNGSRGGVQELAAGSEYNSGLANFVGEGEDVHRRGRRGAGDNGDGAGGGRRAGSQGAISESIPEQPDNIMKSHEWSASPGKAGETEKERESRRARARARALAEERQVVRGQGGTNEQEDPLS